MGPKEILRMVFFFSLMNCEGSSADQIQRERVFHVVLQGKRPDSNYVSRGNLTWPGCVMFCGGCIAFGYDPETGNCSKYYSFSFGGTPQYVTAGHQTFWDRYFWTDDYPNQEVTWAQGRASCLNQGGDLAYFPKFAEYLYLAIQLSFKNGANARHFFGIYKDENENWVKMYDHSKQGYRWRTREPTNTSSYGYYQEGYLRGMQVDEKIVARSLCLKVSKVEYP